MKDFIFNIAIYGYIITYFVLYGRRNIEEYYLAAVGQIVIFRNAKKQFFDSLWLATIGLAVGKFFSLGIFS